jgi:hypothetical protein
MASVRLQGIVAVVVAWFFLAGGESARAESPDAVRLRAELNAAWEARESKITSADFELTFTRSEPKGFAHSIKDARPNPAFRGLGDLPPEDSQTVQTDSVLIAGDKMKHASKGPVLFADIGKYLYQESVTAFNGKECRTLTLIPNKQGVIDDRNTIDIKLLRDFEPLFWLLTPKESVLTKSFGEEVLISEGANEDSGREIKIHFTKTNVVFRIAPALGFNVVGFTRDDEFKHLKHSIRIDVAYAKDDTVGWTPASWVVTSSKGELKSVTSCQVTKAALNEPIEAAAFDIEFSQDTKVIDQTKPRASLSPNSVL